MLRKIRDIQFKEILSATKLYLQEWWNGTDIKIVSCQFYPPQLLKMYRDFDNQEIDNNEKIDIIDYIKNFGLNPFFKKAFSKIVKNEKKEFYLHYFLNEFYYLDNKPYCCFVEYNYQNNNYIILFSFPDDKNIPFPNLAYLKENTENDDYIPFTLYKKIKEANIYLTSSSNTDSNNKNSENDKGVEKRNHYLNITSTILQFHGPNEDFGLSYFLSKNLLCQNIYEYLQIPFSIYQYAILEIIDEFNEKHIFDNYKSKLTPLTFI